MTDVDSSRTPSSQGASSKVTPFGPFYPARLQGAVNHAERLADLLLALERDAPVVGEWGEAWLTGRGSEIEQVVQLLVEAWRGGLAETVASEAIEDYLADLHEGMATQLHLFAPSCCTAPTAATALSLSPPPDPSARAPTVPGPAEPKRSDGTQPPSASVR